MSFWDAYEFWKYPMAGVILAGAMCGALGVYVVLRRVVFVGAALTQVSGVGVAFAFWLGSFAGGDPHDTAWYMNPQVFSLGAAVIGAVLLSFNRGGRRIASDTVVGLAWVLAGAVLLLILSSNRIVQEKHEVDDLLYGSAVLARPAEVKVLAMVTAAILGLHALFFRELLFVTYDADMAQTLGYRTKLWDMVLYASFGLGISFAVRTVGMLPAFGFLAIPSSAALLLAGRIGWALPLAVVFGIGGGALGYYVSFVGAQSPGATIVVCSALFLIPGAILRAVRRDT